MVAAKKAVSLPIQHVKVNLFVLSSNSGDDRMMRNIPAVTMVAACIKAETGVGPSIASGNHVCSPISEDFPIAPISKRIGIHGLFFMLSVNNRLLIVLNFSDPKFLNISSVLISKAMSPTWFIIIALIADLFA